MKHPTFELFVRSAVPESEIKSALYMYNGVLCTGAELPQDEIRRRGLDHKDRRWEGRREDMERLMDKWISKANTLSAALYDENNLMVASYIKEASE